MSRRKRSRLPVSDEIRLPVPAGAQGATALRVRDALVTFFGAPVMLVLLGLGLVGLGSTGLNRILSALLCLGALVGLGVVIAGLAPYVGFFVAPRIRTHATVTHSLEATAYHGEGFFSRQTIGYEYLAILPDGVEKKFFVQEFVTTWERNRLRPQQQINVTYVQSRPWEVRRAMF